VAASDPGLAIVHANAGGIDVGNESHFVAVQATGVYWIALCGVLEQHGIQVVLINAQHTKNVPGRKTDVQECQWLGHQRDGMVNLSWTRLTVTAAPVGSTLTD
jgi:hypothetical protein